MRVFLRFLLFVLLLLSIGVIVYRSVYDFNLIRRGDSFVVKKSSPEGYDYLFQIPRGYNDFSGPQPLLIFLHGAGERGTDPRSLERKAPAFFAKKTFGDRETSYFPFLVVTPICPDARWEPHRVITLLDQVLAENRFRFQVDPDRIYLTGYSMGGFGTFETAMEYPDRFAAIAPVAGGGEPDKAEKLLDVAVWVFHGADDTTVPVPSSALVVERMRELGHKDVAMTTLPWAGHGIVQKVYGKDDLYRWLLLKRKSRFGQEDTFDFGLHPQSEPEERPVTGQEPDSFDDGAGGDTGDLVDGGSTEEELVEPVITEEPHSE